MSAISCQNQMSNSIHHTPITGSTLLDDGFKVFDYDLSSEHEASKLNAIICSGDTGNE